MPESPLISLAAIRGHERPRTFLRAAVVNERLPHALLFAGPDGVGKRSLALAFVAWMQCEGGGEDACGQCASCRQLAADTHPDVQLVCVAPGKKEIGIERIRGVKHFMQLQPMRGKCKVALIDGAHLLTIAAQNALLKVLEEPPARSFLLLISSNPEALLPTVRSRAQRLQFGPLPVETIVEILSRRSDIDPRRARELALLAEGSPGRAQVLAECLAGESCDEWRARVAAWDQRRYVRLTQAAHELSAPEGQLPMKLEMLLSQFRDAAVRASAENVEPGHAAARRLRVLLRQADAVADACSLVRQTNCNRQLLLEALLLRLADS